MGTVLGLKPFAGFRDHRLPLGGNPEQVGAKSYFFRHRQGLLTPAFPCPNWAARPRQDGA